MPDHGVASWVSANDKPTTGAGSKPVSGDAAEQRLKTEVMQLPSRDRRRLKDLSQNEVCLLFKYALLNHVLNFKQFDPHDAFANIFGEHRRPKASRLADQVPASAGGLNKTSKLLLTGLLKSSNSYNKQTGTLKFGRDMPSHLHQNQENFPIRRPLNHECCPSAMRLDLFPAMSRMPHISCL
jgi:hypothetical protein